jgi:hypothetical protein
LRLFLADRYLACAGDRGVRMKLPPFIWSGVRILISAGLTTSALALSFGVGFLRGRLTNVTP